MKKMKLSLNKNEFYLDSHRWNPFHPSEFDMTLKITTHLESHVKFMTKVRKQIEAIDSNTQKRFFFKRISKRSRTQKKWFLIDFYYNLILKYRMDIYSEKIWFNDFIQKNGIFETFFNDFKDRDSIREYGLHHGIDKMNFLKDQQTKTYQIAIVWPLLDVFVAKISQNLFFDKIHYLNIDFYFLLTDNYSSYCLQLYSFFFIKSFKILEIQHQSIKNPFMDNFISFFKEKQRFKKILLQSLLIVSRENHLSLTNDLPMSGRTVYDHIENLYQIFKKKSKWIFRMDFSKNHFSFFHLPIFTWISFEKDRIFRPFSDTLYGLFFFNTIICSPIFKTQIIYLFNFFLWKRIEKHVIYGYYRFYKNHNDTVEKQIIIFKHSMLHICDDIHMNIESSILMKKWLYNYGLKWNHSKFFHSYFSFLKQKPGFDFYGFYLNQNTEYHSFFSTKSKNINANHFKNRILLKTHILPSKFYLLKYLHLLKKIIKQSKTYSQESLIQKLKMIIEKWSFYYRVSTTKKVFHFCDDMLFKWIWKWACRRHPNKNRNWIKKKYYRSQLSTNSSKKKKWHFCVYNSFTKKWFCLPEHTKIDLIRHIKTRRYSTFYHENWKYWLKRLNLF